MAYSGLFITADEKSSFYVFDNIFADIGDEQSIQESLSTFSSHITNIIDIINQASKESLILLDELGSGTDPVEGSCLAISILEYFHNLNALTLCTTHYPEIKEYCMITEGFENACVEFNIETLQPTYKLLIGIPGKSNAFEISKKLGLSEKIINRANSLMNSDSINFEELLKKIYDDKIFIESEKEKILKNSNQIELLKKSLENDLNSIKDKQSKIIEQANQDARSILSDAKEKVAIAIKEINNASSTKNLNNIRNDLNTFIKNTYVSNKQQIIPESTQSIQKGDTVLVTSLNQQGIVLSNPNKNHQVQVQIGVTKLNIDIKQLQFISKTNKNTNNKSTISKSYSNKNKSISNEINVIGNNIEEAIFVVDKFLDDCILSNLNEVRIVHGKGTGILRKGIHDFLKKHPHVESFRLGTFGEGETGATVVYLKK